MPPPRSNFCNISAYCLKLATNLPHPKNFQKKIKIVVALFTIYADISKIIVFNGFSTFYSQLRCYNLSTA